MRLEIFLFKVVVVTQYYVLCVMALTCRVLFWALLRDSVVGNPVSKLSPEQVGIFLFQSCASVFYLSCK